MSIRFLIKSQGENPGYAALTAFAICAAVNYVSGVDVFPGGIPGFSSSADTIGLQQAEMAMVSAGEPGAGGTNSDLQLAQLANCEGCAAEAATNTLDNPWTKLAEKLKSWGNKALNAMGFSNPRYERIYDLKVRGDDAVYFDVFVIDSKFYNKPIAIPTNEQLKEMLNYRGIISEINSKGRWFWNRHMLHQADTFFKELGPRQYYWFDPSSMNGAWTAEAMNYIQIGHGIRHFGWRTSRFYVDNAVIKHNKSIDSVASQQEIDKAYQGFDQYPTRKNW